MCGIDIQAEILAWRRARPIGNFLQETWRKWYSEKISEEYDHIIPFCEGGLTILENMRTLCTPCHKKRTAEWRKAKTGKH